VSLSIALLVAIFTKSVYRVIFVYLEGFWSSIKNIRLEQLIFIRKISDLFPSIKESFHFQGIKAS
jgi:hypothetical protein